MWLRPPQPPTKALAWSSDRDLALLEGPDGASLWDVASGRARAAFEYARHAAFSPSSSHFALQLDDHIRVIERETLRLVTTFKPPKRHTLVALLEGPLRLVTQFESAHYAEPGHQDGLQTWRVQDGALLGQTTCGPVVAVSPERNRAVVQWFWQGETDDSHKVAQIVTFPTCQEVASFAIPESDKSVVTAGAFSRDGQHAFVTVGYRDGNGQALTRGLLKWQAGQLLRSIATFVPRGDVEIDFKDLVMDRSGKRAALVDVERLVPRTCGSCRYADRSSIGYTDGYEDFRVFDAEGNRIEEVFDDAKLAVGFLPPRSVEGRPQLSRQGTVFQAPMGAKKPLWVGGLKEPSTLHHLHVGSDWFSFQRGRTFIHVDLTKGSVASAVTPEEGIERGGEFRTGTTFEVPKGLDKEAARTFKGTLLDRIQLFGDGDRWTLLRPADGARLTLGFDDAPSGPARTILVADAGRFFAEPQAFDGLTFAARGEAGAGRLLSGRDVAKDCLDPELLRKLVDGKPLGCVALRPSD